MIYIFTNGMTIIVMKHTCTFDIYFLSHKMNNYNIHFSYILSCLYKTYTVLMSSVNVLGVDH